MTPQRSVNALRKKERYAPGPRFVFPYAGVDAPPSATRRSNMGNPFCHVELSTDQPGKAREFYARLFSWKYEDAPSQVPGGTYTHIKVGERTGGGLMQKAMAQAPNAWLPYVLVDNVDKTIAKARE